MAIFGPNAKDDPKKNTASESASLAGCNLVETLQSLSQYLPSEMQSLMTNVCQIDQIADELIDIGKILLKKERIPRMQDFSTKYQTFLERTRELLISTIGFRFLENPISYEGSKSQIQSTAESKANPKKSLKDTTQEAIIKKEMLENEQKLLAGISRSNAWHLLLPYCSQMSKEHGIYHFVHALSTPLTLLFQQFSIGALSVYHYYVYYELLIEKFAYADCYAEEYENIIFKKHEKA